MSKSIYPLQNFHYVYRITNLILNKHYYGVRTCKNKLPKDDIGVKYFSSSSDKDFMNDQKVNHSHYRYKVVGVYKTRKRANEIEEKLQRKYNVVISNSFYNMTIQTGTGFDTTGKVPVKDKNGNTFSVPIDDPRLLTGEVVHICAGTLTVKDKDGNFFKMSTNDPRLLTDEYYYVRTGSKLLQSTKDLISKGNSGENSCWFSGYYIVPYYLEKFNSSYALENEGLSAPSMRKYCKTNNTLIITKKAYGHSKFLKNHFGPEIIGKSFKDLGFSFEPKVVS